MVEKVFQGKTPIENHRKCLSKNIVFVFFLNAIMLENVVALLLVADAISFTFVGF